MRLAKVKVQNFRCFRDTIEVEFGGLTALIGQNDAGKSSILDALDVFFNDAKVDRDDRCVYNDSTQVLISCEFDELPEEIVIDATHRTSLENEYLLNPEGRLEITKTYTLSLKTPKLASTHLTAIHPSSPTCGDLLQLKNAELKQRAKDLGIDLEGVPQNTNARLRAAIRDSSARLSLRIQQIPLSDLAGGRENLEQD